MLLLLYDCKKLCLNRNIHQHLNIIQPIIKVIFKAMMVVWILVKNNFIHSQVYFQADLQAVAVCITTDNKTYTAASVYVPLNENFNELAFDRMIKSVLSRYLVLGGFNGHSHLWGANQENEHGKVVEHLIDSHNLILLNDCLYSVWYLPSNQLLTRSFFMPPIYIHGCCMWGFVR